MEQQSMSNNLKVSQIENYENFKNLINDLICYVCLDIPMVPMECYICECRICEDCNEIMKLADKKCITSKCKGNIKKANKFTREVISQFVVTCAYCSKKSIEMKYYQKHLDEVCEIYKLVDHKKTTMLKEIKDKNTEIDKLQDQLNQLKLNTTMSIIGRTTGKITKEEAKSLVSTNLPVSQKMELYNAAVQGDLPLFKNLILSRNFPIFEEISAVSYCWTAFHYAMHYGQVDIINFIFEYLTSKNQLDIALQISSSDGRCPLLCLLRSNSIDIEKKKLIFAKIYQKYKFTISAKVKKELVARDIEQVIRV